MSQLVQFAVPLFHFFFIFELLSYMIFIINHFLINKEMFNKQYLSDEHLLFYYVQLSTHQ